MDCIRPTPGANRTCNVEPEQWLGPTKYIFDCLELLVPRAMLVESDKLTCSTIKVRHSFTLQILNVSKHWKSSAEYERRVPNLTSGVLGYYFHIAVSDLGRDAKETENKFCFYVSMTGRRARIYNRMRW